MRWAISFVGKNESHGEMEKRHRKNRKEREEQRGTRRLSSKSVSCKERRRGRRKRQFQHWLGSTVIEENCWVEQCKVVPTEKK
jgi:hypothetical protein